MHKTRTRLDISLNDSDDSAFINKTPVQKRKAKTVLESSKHKLVKNETYNTRSSSSKADQSTSSEKIFVESKSSMDSIHQSIGEESNLLTVNTFKTVSNKEVQDSEVVKKALKPTKQRKEAKVSEFFNSKRSKSFSESFSCPLCSKFFDSKSTHLSHMKLCAKKKKLSTAELLEAIEAKNNKRSLGSLKEFSSASAVKASSKNSGARDNDDYAMAVALSVSSSPTRCIIDRTVVESQRATLETFGFTGGGPSTGLRRGKGLSSRSSILRTRTPEERLKILTEKTAVILLSEEIKCPSEQNSETPSSGQCSSQENRLWKLGETECDGPWLIESLNVYLTNMESALKTPFCEITETEAHNYSHHFDDSPKVIASSPSSESQSTKSMEASPARLIEFENEDTNSMILFEDNYVRIKSPVYDSEPFENNMSYPIVDTVEEDSGAKPSASEEAVSVSKVEEMTLTFSEHMTNISLDEVISDSPKTAKIALPNDEDLSLLLYKITLPSNTLIQDWAKMVDNEEGSDFSVTVASGKFHLHKIVLQVRCPIFLETVCFETFRKIPYSTAQLFFKFIYTGVIEKIARSDLVHLSKLGNLFKMDDLCKVVEELRNLIKRGSSVPNILKSLDSSSLNQGETSEVTSLRNNSHTSEKNDNSPKSADEADTVPVQFDDEISIFSQETERRHLEVVDLTQNMSPQSCEDDTHSAEKSFLAVLSFERKREEEIERQREEDFLESLERASEMEKIQSFIQQNESNKSKAKDLENEELEESLKEREKIFNISRCSQRDLFENVDSEVEVIPTGTDDDVLLVSSDEDKTIFEVTTDDDNTEVAKTECIANKSLVLPPISPKDDDYLDCPQFGVISMTPCKSQSLVSNRPSPRTPRKVLSSPALLNTSTSSTVKELPYCTEEDILTNIIQSSPSQSTALIEETSNIDHIEEGGMGCGKSFKECGGIKRRRSSALQSLGKKIVRRSKKALNEKRSGVDRIKLLKSQAIASNSESLLSNSLINGLNETWSSCTAHTPEDRRTYVEITPRCTPSVKLIDKVTPRPDYSAMKSASMKKHLQKYGLKRGIGKTKAKKILSHIYDELHPIINTETGKFVRYLHKDDNQKKDCKKTRKCVRSKAKSTQKSNSASSKSPLKVVNPELPSCHSDSNNSLSSIMKGSESENSEFTDEEFADLEDEILSQQNTQSTPALKLEDAVILYIKSNPELHRSILLYSPIWVDDFRKNLQTAYGAKYKLIDIMDFLDKKCITYRSEAQAANNKRRNDRKKSKKSPKKKELSS